MPTRELAQGPSFGVNSKGEGTATRVFETDVLGPAARTAEGIPALGTPHPNEPLLLARNVEVRPRGDNRFSEVVVTYTSSSQRFYKPPKEPDEDFLPQFELGFERTTIDVPYAFRVKQRVAEDPPTDTFVWQVREQKVRLNNLVLSHRCVVQRLTLGDADTILSQIDTLHFFGGRQWLMRAPQVTMEEDQRTSIRYQWVADNFVIPPLIPGLAFGVEYVVALGRSPFHEFTVVPNQQEAGGPPQMLTFLPYPVDNFGWRDLPGIRIP